jgi:signal transduction histidine kinase
MISSYPGVFAQVISNLVLNSITHAYPHNESGQLRFLLKKQKKCLLIEYSDDGSGIPTEHLTKIFDPFFTTARNRGGIGLGMYIVYNLVTQKLHGTIQCDSQVGIGTTFTIELPLE